MTFPHLLALLSENLSGSEQRGLPEMKNMTPAQATGVDVFVKAATMELTLLSNKSPQIPKHIFKIYFQNHTECNSTNQ